MARIVGGWWVVWALDHLKIHQRPLLGSRGHIAFIAIVPAGISDLLLGSRLDITGYLHEPFDQISPDKTDMKYKGDITSPHPSTSEVLSVNHVGSVALLVAQLRLDWFLVPVEFRLKNTGEQEYHPSPRHNRVLEPGLNIMLQKK